ncbi:hypothetical protein B6V00_05480 [ANME-1 cluster archaeon ex4572_4]|nr:MAG: hypothetical protein B6V00_05480 [ANME-1 cluster archaeon ex4572_4]
MVCLRDAFQPAGREKDEEGEGVEELAAELKLTIEEEKCVGCRFLFDLFKGLKNEKHFSERFSASGKRER